MYFVFCEAIACLSDVVGDYPINQAYGHIVHILDPVLGLFQSELRFWDRDNVPLDSCCRWLMICLFYVSDAGATSMVCGLGLTCCTLQCSYY